MDDWHADDVVEWPALLMIAFTSALLSTSELRDWSVVLLHVLPRAEHACVHVSVEVPRTPPTIHEALEVGNRDKIRSRPRKRTERSECGMSRPPAENMSPGGIRWSLTL